MSTVPEGGTGERSRPVVVFDFDGTLTRPDTFRLFLTQIQTPRSIVSAFVRHAPSVAMALRGGRYRDRAKELVCADLLGGVSDQLAQDVAHRTAGIILETALRQDCVARLSWHLSEGHRVIVVSVSFEAYVKPVMAELGVHEVIATRWEVGENGLLTGRFAGVNVRGPAKAELLTHHLGGMTRIGAAYGNTQGDAALLAMAVYPVWIRRWRSISPIDLLLEKSIAGN